MSESTVQKKNSLGVTLALLAALVLLFAIPMLIAPEAPEGEEAFGGTDAAATEQLEEDGYEPWFSPVFEPGSGEIESGLFALQAALGAGVLGYAIGHYSARRRNVTEPAPDPAEPRADG
ncbi:energy-coupling factor ABC transporter substrate-binding protein [Propioniferax innocua]|uniref:Cobalt transport protein CbiN n=1 Tax=Propioniferax innocua TaxID=1753 RepID=A0A542ZD06_9ACTN|nr:energy-coupling factor ABC transporter substrate-binding protein [Propioniferax innocua]TQL58140.1 cobalt/nickel transport protein [Propioniferax innocua]